MDIRDGALGLLGPVSLHSIVDLLHPADRRNDFPPGPGGTPVTSLARAFVRRGQRVVLFSMAMEFTEERVLEGENLRVCIGPYRPRGRARDVFAAERAYLRHAIARERPALLHAHWTYEYAMAAQDSGLPHLITAHDAPWHVLRHDPTPYRFVRTLMAYRVLLRARRVVCVSPYVESHLRRFMGFRGRADVIPNGIDADLFQPVPQPAPGSAPGRPFTFACVLNGWGRRKNGEGGIRAFAAVRGRLPEARLLMFGAGFGPGEAAQRWASERGLEAGIQFVGMLPHADLLGRLADEVDVLLHPALEESHGVALVEAMARGIPVIGGASSGAVPWTLDFGKAGLLTDVRSPAAMAAAMHVLATEPSRAAALGRSGFELARRRFNLGPVADAHAALYDEIAGDARHRPAS